MCRGSCRTEDALTGLELVLIIILLVAGGASVLIYAGGETPDLARTFPGGVTAESMYISGDHIQTFGNVYGFPMISRTNGNLPVIMNREDPGRLGVARVTVSLFIGSTGAIDMDRLAVQWSQGGNSSILHRTAASVLVCPNWTISNKYNLLPGRSADSDDWLEPNEQFELTVCPSEGTKPYGVFSLNLQPDGIAIPLTVTRTTPARIQPVMNLG
jgi:hypothetical protein